MITAAIDISGTGIGKDGIYALVNAKIPAIGQSSARRGVDKAVNCRVAIGGGRNNVKARHHLGI